MTAHPARYLHARTSMVFRSGSFARRDRTSGSQSFPPSVSSAAAATTAAAAATAAAKSTSVSGPSATVQAEDHNAADGQAATSSDMMQVEGETGGDNRGIGDVVIAAGLDGTAGGSIRFRRVLSSPGARAGPMFYTNEVSNAGGVTMDVINGGVRSKTSPTAARLTRTGGAFSNRIQNQRSGRMGLPGDRASTGFGRVPSMGELTAIVAEASGERSPKSELGQETSSLVASLGDTDDEREYRATSMADCWSPSLNDSGAQGPSKRAKSGVELMPNAESTDHHLRSSASGIFGAAGAGVGGVGGFMSMEHDGRDSVAFSTPTVTPANRVSSARENVARSGESGTLGVGDGERVARSGDGSSAPVSTARGSMDDSERTNTGSSVEGEPTTNEGWLTVLAPLVGMVPQDTHPEDFLHDILRERGYSTTMVPGRGSAFHRPPAPEQVTAYDKAILRAILDEDEATLESMRSAGRRMDACNRFGDSVLHMACRRGRVDSLRYLLRVCGSAGLELTDDFGRTVMHDACWLPTPRFDIASIVLDTDTRLLRILDKRGSSPLQYVPRGQWPQWCAFFESRKELYWPPLAPGEEDVAGIIPLD